MVVHEWQEIGGPEWRTKVERGLDTVRETGDRRARGAEDGQR